MKAACFFLFLVLVANVAAENEVTLNVWQTNLTVNGSIASFSRDAVKRYLVAASGNALIFWFRTTQLYFRKWHQVTVNDTVLEVKMTDYGRHVAAIGTTKTQLYVLLLQTNQYSITHTIELNQKPTVLTAALDGEILLVGLVNGSISVYTRNPTTDTFLLSQTINTTHSYVAKIVGVTSRFVSCGRNDSVVNVYFYNFSLKAFKLNQSLADAGSGSCTALDLSTWEDRIVVGRSNGDVTVYKADDSMVYTRQVALAGAHNTSIRFVIVTNYDVSILTAGDDGTLKLWTQVNKFTIPTTQPINATAAGWNHYARELIIADNNSNLTVFQFVAGNCTTKFINPEDPAQCSCPGGQVWLKGKCSDCKSAPGSAGTANSTTKTTCSCLPGTSWKYSLQRCIIDCLPTSSNGSQYQFNSCYCNNGSIWDYSLKACIVNCSLVDRAVGNFNHTVCNCSVGFYWDTKKTLCVVNCTGKANSNGKSLRTATCECNSGYLWDGATLACTSTSGSSIKGGGGCSKSSNSTAIGLAIGIPLGLLALCGIAAIGWYIYKTRQNEQQKAVSSLAGYAAPISSQRQIPELKSATDVHNEQVAGQRIVLVPDRQQRGALIRSEVITEEEMVPKHCN